MSIFGELLRQHHCVSILGFGVCSFVIVLIHICKISWPSLNRNVTTFSDMAHVHIESRQYEICSRRALWKVRKMFSLSGTFSSTPFFFFPHAVAEPPFGC